MKNSNNKIHNFTAAEDATKIMKHCVQPKLYSYLVKEPED